MPLLQEARIPTSEDPTGPLPVLPQYFVDRNDILCAIQSFLEKARLGQSARRSFVIKGNSGWGKSSLVLKLLGWAHGLPVQRISLTAADSRVAKDRSFVTESIRLALSDALRFIDREEGNLLVRDADPLASPDVITAFASFREKAALSVLVFDQFEDFVTRPELGKAFAVVTDLIRDLERTKPPFAVGFTWKSDLSGSYSDRAFEGWRASLPLMEIFRIDELRASDVWKIVEFASKNSSGEQRIVALPYDLKSRIVDQSANYPWLAKKLLTHVFRRIAKGDSPKDLLAENLAIERLFKDDVQELDNASDKCLRFVAARGAIDLSGTDGECSEKVLTELVKSHLLVKLGPQYRVSSDILRAYLVNGKVPSISWAPLLNYPPDRELITKALKRLQARPRKTDQLRSFLKVKQSYLDGFSEDLVALGVAEFVEEDRICVSPGLETKGEELLMRVVCDNLRRHEVYRAFAQQISVGGSMPSENWHAFFLKADPRARDNPGKAWERHSRALRGWLQFGGLIEESDDSIIHAEAGHATLPHRTNFPGAKRQREKLFAGSCGHSRLEELVTQLRRKPAGVPWKSLERRVTSNAITEAIALELAQGQQGEKVYLAERGWQGDPLSAVRRAVEETPSMQTVRRLAADDGLERFTDPREAIGGAVAKDFGKRWTKASALRVGAGLISFYRWLESLRFAGDERSTSGLSNQLEESPAKRKPKDVPRDTKETLMEETWELLENVAVELYASGPDAQNLWERAGGSNGDLKFSETGRNRWRHALTEARRGKGIQLDKLLREMRRDYPKNENLGKIAKELVQGRH
jgi:hypothetical protein